MNNNYLTLCELLDKLKLTAIKNHIDNVIDRFNNNDYDYIESLIDLFKCQVDYNDNNVYKACVKVAHFPFIKSIEDYDFSFQPSISKREINDLCSLRFITNKENILFIGTPGVGKTHLATTIGIEAARNSYSTYFITCKDLIWQLNKAKAENCLERRLKHFHSYSLLIIDEVGHDILNNDESIELFQLLQLRYEKHSTIITTNYSINCWDQIFVSNKIVLNAMLDRFLHHCRIVQINGPSYRRKDLSQYFDDEC
jgi:DNA replication protein DnaC